MPASMLQCHLRPLYDVVDTVTLSFSDIPLLGCWITHNYSVFAGQSSTYFLYISVFSFFFHSQDSYPLLFCLFFWSVNHWNSVECDFEVILFLFVNNCLFHIYTTLLYFWALLGNIIFVKVFITFFLTFSEKTDLWRRFLRIVFIMENISIFTFIVSIPLNLPFKWEHVFSPNDHNWRA